MIYLSSLVKLAPMGTWDAFERLHGGKIVTTKFSTSDDIYRELVQESAESWLYGLVAFAIIEERRIDWTRHYEDTNGRPPNSDEIRSWYEQQPESELLRAKGEAENALREYSDEVIQSNIEEYGEEIKEDIIVCEIKKLGRFWPQFGVNLAGGVTSAVLFAVLLIAFAFFVLNDISPVQIGVQVGENPKGEVEVIDDGKQ
uniref:Uncharacterized protein n=1 Tax=Candidatus Kentrum sp. FM TaxID=2126340 RepID=A0A450S327_9GAMM|nr:MAG: hypothetical protein BECKFM1743A_GA0114220_100326 [Candidatus Kentron sp. FM]VFJ73065.1 MAG: hypothetical protein BECKFM1743C_GA0114222_106985 [Candidatus Kentron sp. FM]VFK06431.1 MAG: hypothetical protein BECKFM1743B_GA0114221_100178 [Candidatus Kentron sp. FM]